MKIKSLSIFVFSYNEADNLRRLIPVINMFLADNVVDGELIIVNDGSVDDTEGVLEDYKSEPNVRIIHHEKNKGIGEALKSGYRTAKKEWIVGVPGDGQFDVEELLNIKEWRNDYFYAFYRPQKKYNWYRNFLTKFNLFINRFFLKNPLQDVNWIKVYSRNQINDISIKLNSSLIESEISSKLLRKGFLYKELPSKYLERKNGQPKGGNLKTVSKAFFEMLKLIRIINFD